MDEPFGALDPINRDQLQNEFLELESEIEKTIVFVTHDVFEAVKMGDRIALLDQGRLQQLATPSELVEKPANEVVDQFLGQQRFQLALVTRTVGSILGGEDRQPPEEAQPEAAGEGPRLAARSSLIAGLDLFKKSGRQRLTVYRRGEPIGCLTRDRLLEEITGVLGSAGEEP
jgi:osmoprotectant transport system ATP-binding protein